MVKKYRFILYYFFLLAGALWNYLDMFQNIMANSAGIVMILVGLISVWESTLDQGFNKKYLNYLLDVAFIAFMAEAIGTHKGWIFGDYYYGTKLWPSLLSVPIAIAFAWVSTLLGSIVAINHLVKSNIYIKSILSGLMMTFFDLVMEPAAISLEYWTWVDGIIPIFNYLSWFVLGTAFSFFGYKKFDFNSIKNMNIFHLFNAQFFYFLLTQLKFIN